jgi:hypothetical protein
MGGKPSTATPKDKRLAANRPPKSVPTGASRAFPKPTRK